MKTALKPDYYSDFRTIKTLKDKPKVDEDERDISLMGKTRGWLLINDFIENIKTDLDLIVIQLMEQGADFNIIGQKTVVKEICKEMLERIQTKVKDSKEAVENNE